MSKIPGYIDQWNDTKEKYNIIYDTFKTNVIGYVESRHKERKEYDACIKAYLEEKDKCCREKIIEFNDYKKKIIKGMSNVILNHLL